MWIARASLARRAVLKLWSFSNESRVNSDAATDIFGLIEQTVGDSGEQWNAIDVEKLEEVLYLLHSSVDGSETLESSLSALNLSLNEDFVFRVLETPLLPGGYLIRFFRWAMERKDLHITTPLLDTLVLGVCQNVQRNGAYALWDLIKEIGEKKKANC
ncbi:hypothetical protein V2J09_023686 [Rumex salicifolius]